MTAPQSKASLVREHMATGRWADAVRLAASFLQDAFSSPIVVKAFSIFSFLGLGLMGLSGSSFIMDDGSFVTVLGIFCALWMILAAFQL